MGWTFTHRDRGVSNRDWFQREVCGPHNTIVACATVNNVFYAAVQNDDQAAYKPGETWGLVVLTQRSRGYHNYGWKEMDEETGPFEENCPARVLDLLSPADNERALEWRKNCRANAAKAEAAKAVKPGATVKFTPALEFTSGDVADTLRFLGRSTFQTPRGAAVRVPSWRTRYSWSVVTDSGR